MSAPAEKITVPMEAGTGNLAKLQRELEAQGRYIAILEVRKGFWVCTVQPKPRPASLQRELFEKGTA